MRFVEYIKEELGKNISDFFNLNYGPYKDDDFEYLKHFIKGVDVSIIFVPVTDKPDIKPLEKDIKYMAKKWGIKYIKYQNVRDNYIFTLKRILLRGKK